MDLFSIDKIEVTDPEVTGISYPVDRSIHVGFALKFLILKFDNMKLKKKYICICCSFIVHTGM